MPSTSPASTVLRRRALRFWLRVIIGWFLGGVFVYAGWLKTRDPAAFVTSIRGFHILPDPGPALLALTLPWLEIFAGLAVMTGWLRRGGLILINLALLVFLGALITAWVRGINVDCGCFGDTQHSSVVQDLIRDVVLLAGGLWLWFTEPQRGRE